MFYILFFVFKVEGVLQAVDQVAALLASNTDRNLSYKDNVINLCQHLKVSTIFIKLNSG